MKFDDIKIGQEVKAYYRKESVYGTVIKKLKTVLYVKFHDKIIKYDKAHVQFLTKV